MQETKSNAFCCCSRSCHSGLVSIWLVEGAAAVMQAEWLEDCSQLKKRARGPPICGEVTSVSREPQSRASDSRRLTRSPAASPK